MKSFGRFLSLLLLLSCTVSAGWAAPTKLIEQAPVSITPLPDGAYLLDFGRVLFGNLVEHAPQARADVVFRFGEALRDGRVDRTPPGSVRYAEVRAAAGTEETVVAPPPDARNTTPPAVLTPPSWGVLLPFRWVEVQGWPGRLQADEIHRRVAVDSTWEESAASFHSSDAMLDRVWTLSHDSIEATTFAGVFVDGDRERLSYEADAYLNQLSYYAGDANPQMARDTFARLRQYPTWPTEWAPHMVLMAYADWMQTGDRAWLAAQYEWLKTKTLEDRVGADGLVHSTAAQMRRGDIVDWPTGERDGFVFTPVNVVVNAFYLRALGDMRQLATVLGKEDEAKRYAEAERKGAEAFQQAFSDEQSGLYRDGEGTDHTSMHANLFPLAFGLVPPERRQHIAAWLASRGMRVSVYAAQYLLEGLFENGQATAALREIVAPGDRSWRHMVESGATITWEAWDQSYKPNQDWNHAWGAAPANLLPRFVLGVQLSKPGWKEVLLQPQTGGLRSAEGVVPTPLGSVQVHWRTESRFHLSATLPAGMVAQVRVPAAATSQGVRVNGKPVPAHREADCWVLDATVKGNVSLEVR